MRIIFESPTLSISSTLSLASQKIIQKELAVKGGLFLNMKDVALGKKYELSIVFVGKKLGKKLNTEHRKKNYATDILSFPIDKNAGEIFLQYEALKKKAKEFGRTPENYLRFLVIHGLIHLKGFDHGSRMESEEARVRALFKI